MIFCNPKDGGRSEGVISPGVLPKTLVIFAILWGGVCWGLPSNLLAQPPDAKPPGANETTPVLPGQDSATIGQSGFKVPIPEIKMNRILGGPKGPKQTPPPSREPRSGEQPEPLQPKSSEEGPRRPAAQPPPPKGEPAQGAAQEPAPAPEPIATPPRESAPTQMSGPKKSPREHPSQTTETGEPESQPSSTVAPVPPGGVDRSRKEEVEMIMRAPQAPEDTIGPPPPPRKEVLRPKSVTPLPTLLKNAPSKEGPAALSIPRTEADDLADPREWVQLDQRRVPEIEPPLELEPLPPEKIGGGDLSIREPERGTRFRESGPQARPEAKPKVGPAEALPPPSQTDGASSPVAEPEGAKETPGTPTAIKPDGEDSPTKESISPSEGVPSPPKEVLPSPLDDRALASPEVRDYLRQAAPILEELSVLMTTAPSLNLADYDPSDSASPAIPKDIYLRMDAIKRQLQILDSKTFAIIPPPKYTAYHSLIRESIAETYQACTAIMGYLQENNAEDLRVIRDHLLRARKLIQRTRPRAGQG